MAELHFSEITIPLGETGYGSGQHNLFTVSSKSKWSLRKYLEENAYKRTHEGDRPGQVYVVGIKCLCHHRDDSGMWTAICVSSSYWDV